MNIRENGLHVTIRGLHSLHGRLANTAPLMHQIGQMLSNSTVERFHTGTDPDGKDWQRLKPATILRKGNDKILVAKGDLMDSITFRSSKAHVFIYSNDRNQGKVEAHQHGNPDRNLPKRAIFGLSQGDREDVENTVIVWLEGTS